VFNARLVTTIVLAGLASALVALDLTGHLQARALLVRAKTPAYNLVSLATELREGERRRAELAERLARRSAALGRAESYRRENEALRLALGYRVEMPYEWAYAPLLERRPRTWLATAVVGAGRREGVAEGMPVVGTRGLAGRVVRAAATTAEIELLTSERLRLAVRHAPSGTLAVYYAGAEGPGRLAYAPRTAAFKVGDLIVTSGTSRLYPPGLVVGYVRAVDRPFDSMFLEVEVTPAEDMAALENLFVVKWRPPVK
jgi:rod shape-determining protein MreC